MFFFSGAGGNGDKYGFASSVAPLEAGQAGGGARYGVVEVGVALVAGVKDPALAAAATAGAQEHERVVQYTAVILGGEPLEAHPRLRQPRQDLHAR